MAFTSQSLKPSIRVGSYPFRNYHLAPFQLNTNTHFLGIGNATKTNYASKFNVSLQNPTPTFSRRLMVSSVSSIWDTFTGGNNKVREAGLAVRRGMVLFRQGDVLGSLVEFDKAIELDPRQKQYLWQRGLSLYYLNRFEEGAEQFRTDVAMNPNDTEESIWCFLCEAQLSGAGEARNKFLEVGEDSRPVMRKAYQLFKDGGDPEQLVTDSSGREIDYFYASLYAGLYYEAENNADGAKVHIVAACKSPYAQRSDDYMAAVAKVHRQCRDWSI